MARFFIDRPIFAWVIAILIMVAGAISMTRLPISRYPTIAPPSVTINAAYPGASARAVEDSVTQVIEQAMTGLDGLLYIASTSESNGLSTITLTFDSGVNPDTAQVQVQNKLAVATPSLPQIVQTQGITVSKANPSFLMVMGFVSEDGSMDQRDIADYVRGSVMDPISRVDGVGNVRLFGARYAMRIWLDPGKLDTYKLTPAEIIAAIRAQNAQVAVGQLGGTPAVPGQQLNATVTAQERLQTPEQFRAIVVRSRPDGSLLRLGDVARVELGAEDYSTVARYNGRPSAGIAISLATNANALATAQAIESLIRQMQPTFPKGLRAVVPFDTTPFVLASIKEVVKTLLEAVLLVFLVMYLFLQNFRATLIPTIAVPVVLLGTFAVLAGAGLLDQHAHHVRHGARHRPAGGRRHRGGRERRAPHERGGAHAARGHAQVHGPDHRRARGGGDDPRGGLRADGLPGRLDRRHLPAVLRDHRLGHRAVRARGHRPHAGAVRDHDAADREGPPRLRYGLLRLVQQGLRPRQRPLPEVGARASRAGPGATSRSSSPWRR